MAKSAKSLKRRIDAATLAAVRKKYNLPANLEGIALLRELDKRVAAEWEASGRGWVIRPDEECRSSRLELKLFRAAITSDPNYRRLAKLAGSESPTECARWLSRYLTRECGVSALDLERAELATLWDYLAAGDRCVRRESRGKRRGRPRDTDAEADAALLDQWQKWRMRQRKRATVAKFAAIIGRKVGDVQAALERARKRS